MALSACPLIGNCGHRLRFERDGSVRGRDASYLAPPAQIHACPIRAYGSRLGCVTAFRDILAGSRRMRFSTCDTGFPVLRPARALLIHIPLGPHPWLHRLRCRLPGFVRADLSQLL